MVEKEIDKEGGGALELAISFRPPWTCWQEKYARVFVHISGRLFHTSRVLFMNGFYFLGHRVFQNTQFQQFVCDINTSFKNCLLSVKIVCKKKNCVCKKIIVCDINTSFNRDFFFLSLLFFPLPKPQMSQRGFFQVLKQNFDLVSGQHCHTCKQSLTDCLAHAFAPWHASHFSKAPDKWLVGSLKI